MRFSIKLMIFAFSIMAAPAWSKDKCEKTVEYTSNCCASLEAPACLTEAQVKTQKEYDQVKLEIEQLKTSRMPAQDKKLKARFASLAKELNSDRHQNCEKSAAVCENDCADNPDGLAKCRKVRSDIDMFKN